ncbi:isoaspartyl peptidase/L-asparaginase family protein [Terricaulis silvestris]|uniref:Isoaspartyl peptidase n=1 Tax=Terricaulis silvestris TaxID=2686094 RepID=A0A6I6MVB9_9CAUL|nr:isoaspartyl peptidase/L-asparaginase [Terricaulis silvestris]QGZ96707.1 Isoaspartyl peptidase precursor [Terricaulis silvestris]
MTVTWALALHGGAGAIAERAYKQEEAHMAALLDEGAAMLTRGVSALDVVTAMAEALEASGLHVAGKGAAPNAAGVVELDASIMDGDTRNAGAVAGLRGFVSPIRAARAVMEHTPHVLLVGDGAGAFAAAQNLARVEDPKSYYTPAESGLPGPESGSGTIGAVALDISGKLAAATSTGGLGGKMPGRVGDTPIIGAGCWADRRAAISCTGLGEYFIRVNAAADVSARIAYAGQTLESAAASVIEDVRELGGYGGLIAVDAHGNIAAPFASQGMKRGIASSSGRREVKTFQ